MKKLFLICLLITVSVMAGATVRSDARLLAHEISKTTGAVIEMDFWSEESPGTYIYFVRMPSYYTLELLQLELEILSLELGRVYVVLGWRRERYGRVSTRWEYANRSYYTILYDPETQLLAIGTEAK